MVEGDWIDVHEVSDPESDDFPYYCSFVDICDCVVVMVIEQVLVANLCLTRLVVTER